MMIFITSIFLLIAFQLQAQMQNSFETYLHELAAEFPDVNCIDSDTTSLEDYLILDTREKNEYDVSRIRKAVWIGYTGFDIALLDSVKRDQDIIVYCSVGYRSSIIAQQLMGAGFLQVKNLHGGIFKWANAGNPLYRDEDKVDQIHGYSRRWATYITNPFLEIVF
jgi:rhodanese-related sulfurtransferase